VNQQVSNKQRNQNRSKLIILILMFFGSVFIAWLLINNADTWRPWGTKNNGDLVIPARPVTDLTMQTLDDKSFTIKEMVGKWVMVYIGKTDCDEICKTNLYNIRQSRLGQKGEHARIERLYIMVGDKPTASLNNAMTENQGMKVVRVNAEILPKLLSTFKIKDGVSADTTTRIYLIDPIGNLMMKYEQGFDPRGIAKDIELLLKVSLVG
jgi:cytochrome oxidase Cu insertion factor (SCO1/SenC/PrrC family)